MGAVADEKAYGKMVKEIYDKSEAKFTDELPAAIDAAKARLAEKQKAGK